MFLSNHRYNTAGTDDCGFTVSGEIVLDGYNITGTELFLCDWFSHTNRNNLWCRERHSRNTAVLDLQRVITHDLYDHKVAVLITAVCQLFAFHNVTDCVNIAYTGV